MTAVPPRSMMSRQIFAASSALRRSRMAGVEGCGRLETLGLGAAGCRGTRRGG